VAGIARFTTGLPVTLLNNNDTSLLGTIPNGINNNGVDTPQWSGNSLNINTNPRNGAAVFDAGQFSLPRSAPWATRAGGSSQAPHGESRCHCLARVFAARGRSFEFRAEGFNVCNHAQFFGPATEEGNISSGTFGQAVSAMPPRLMQVAMRVRF